MQFTNLKKSSRKLHACMFNYHFIDGWYWKQNFLKILARNIIIFTRLHIYTLHKPLAKKYNLRPNYQFVEW